LFILPSRFTLPVHLGRFLLTGLIFAPFAFSAIGETPTPVFRLQEKVEDLDVFMKEVLKARKVNWDELRNYVFSETEELEIRGSTVAALQSFKKEYVWYERDGYLYRSPVRANGVKLSPKEQKASEKRWGRGEKKRPFFFSREDFMDFDFEAGNYYFEGRQTFNDREVVAIEYYPENLFSDPGDDNKEEEEEKFEKAFEKTSLVSMLIDPKEHQLVHFTFHNIGLDFLPYRWLIRVDDISASMTMDKPLENVWLPVEISVAGGVSTANGTFSVRYSRKFFDYKKTKVKVKLDFEDPK